MEDKNLYNKVMLIAFCIILVLLGAGMYSRSTAAQRASENYVPEETSRKYNWKQSVPLYEHCFDIHKEYGALHGVCGTGHMDRPFNRCAEAA